MVILHSGVTAAIFALSLFGWGLAVPLADKLDSLSLGARNILQRTVPTAQRFCAYSDEWVWPLPSPTQLKGYNVYILSFWLSHTHGPTDMASAWAELTKDQRTSYLREYNDAGISLIVSAFGDSDTPTSSGENPVTVANELASWVRKHHLQGVDIDYEDFGAFNSNHGIAEPWLISLTRQLRTHLPQGEYILTHAPVAPWFVPNRWSGGGYLQVYYTVGHLIDWFNVQFYNQGTTEYTTCHGLLYESTSQWPKSALFQIAGSGVDLQKLVIGKPGNNKNDAKNGYVTPWKLHYCATLAHSAGWDAGIMVWEYPDVGAKWISEVRGTLWPV